MRITRRIKLDIETGEVLEHDWYEYAGPLALCKHEEEKALAASQTEFYEMLKGIFQKQFGAQSKVLETLNSYLLPYLEKPTGYTPAQEAALRTGASEGISKEYESASRNFQERAFMLGGRDLPSGALLSGLGSLESMRAGMEAGAQREITLRNEDLKRQNFWSAAGMLSGNLGIYNPAAYGGLASSTGTSAFQMTQAAYANPWEQLLSGLAGGALSAASSYFAGGA